MESLYCGKALDSGKLVYGCYVHQHGSHEIHLPSSDDDGWDYYHVDPETVRPFVGLYDCTKWEELTTEEQALFLYPLGGGKRSKDEWPGRPIFLGDIVKHYNRPFLDADLFDIGVIFWDDKECKIARTSSQFHRIFNVSADCTYKIIGNIYDNKVEDFTNEND